MWCISSSDAEEIAHIILSKLTSTFVVSQIPMVFGLKSLFSTLCVPQMIIRFILFQASCQYFTSRIIFFFCKSGWLFIKSLFTVCKVTEYSSLYSLTIVLCTCLSTLVPKLWNTLYTLAKKWYSYYRDAKSLKILYHRGYEWPGKWIFYTPGFRGWDFLTPKNPEDSKVKRLVLRGV